MADMMVIPMIKPPILPHFICLFSAFSDFSAFCEVLE